MENTNKNEPLEHLNFKKKVTSIIPNDNDIEVFNYLRNRINSITAYFFIEHIENYFKLENSDLIFKIKTTPKKELLKEEELFLTTSYSDFHFLCSKYSINKFILLLKDYGAISSKFIKTKKNERIFFIYYISTYYLLYPYKFYMYDFLRKKNQINENLELEKEIEEFTNLIKEKDFMTTTEALLYFNQKKINIVPKEPIKLITPNISSMEDKGLLSPNSSKDSLPDNKEKVKETDSIETDTPKKDDPKSSFGKGKKPKKPSIDESSQPRPVVEEELEPNLEVDEDDEELDFNK